jgi:uncharacterized protein
VLIEAAADIEAVAAEDGAVPGGTALMHAAVFGMTDALIAAGTPADVPDDHGRLPLAEAMEHRREEAADRLRAAGAE